MAANLLRTFAHPANSPMPLLTISFEEALFNTPAVVTKAEPHFIAPVSDFNFDVLCLRVLEGIRKGFSADGENLVLDDGMQGLRIAVHCDCEICTCIVVKNEFPSRPSQSLR